MKRPVLFIFMTLAICGSWLLPQGPVRAGVSPDACSLYTQADAAALFGHAVSAGLPRTTMFPAGESCRYSFTAKGDSYGITVRISTSAALEEEGINSSAADLMTRQKQARKRGHAAKTFRPVSGLGEDAFWNGTDLWVLQGDNLLIIKVHSLLAGSFKDMAEARKAREAQDLDLSQKAAQTVLPRL
jgi:hypothetical protein